MLILSSIVRLWQLGQLMSPWLWSINILMLSKMLTTFRNSMSSHIENAWVCTFPHRHACAILPTRNDPFYACQSSMDFYEVGTIRTDLEGAMPLMKLQRSEMWTALPARRRNESSGGIRVTASGGQSEGEAGGRSWARTSVQITPRMRGTHSPLNLLVWLSLAFLLWICLFIPRSFWSRTGNLQLLYPSMDKHEVS